MPFERQTARKVRIADIVTGDFVKKEGMESSYVVTPLKEKVARARILATVVSKFMSDDKNFASITLDDSTGTIQGKVWKELKPLEKVAVGDLVDVIGKVREYEGDIYVVPEIVTSIKDPNIELMRKLELLSKMKKSGEPGGKGKASGENEKTGEEEIRKKVISIIEGSKDGIKYSELITKAGFPEEQIEPVINELLGEGICYEPTPGKIKKI